MATTSYQIGHVTPQTLVNATMIGSQFVTATVGAGGGNTAVFYYDGSLGNANSRLLARLVGPDGNPAGPEVTVATGGLAGIAASDTHPTGAARLSNGDIVATWADNATSPKVHYRVYDSNLNPLTDVLGNVLGTFATIHPSVAALAGGGFVVAFEFPGSLTDHDIYAKRYDALGNQVGGLVAVNTSAGTFDEYPRVAGLADGGFAVAHDRHVSSGSTAWESVWNADGTVRLADTQFDVASSSCDVQALPNGGFVVSYPRNGITSTRFSAAGVSGTVTGDTLEPEPYYLAQASLSPDGYAFVGYFDGNASGLGQRNYASLLAPDGTRLLADAPLDFNDGSQRTFPSVTWIDGSHVFLAETNNSASLATGGDGSGSAVDCQILVVTRFVNGDSLTPIDYSTSGINTVANLGAGNDTFYAGSGTNYVVGNGGDDVLVGGAGTNTIYALGGSSYIQGGAGSPSDLLVATGAGNDTFYGGSGNNYIVGGTGHNTIVGGPNGLESLYSSGAADYIVGGGTSCVISESGAGSDTLFGGVNSNNYIVGSGGNDLAVGGNLSDYLFGAAGDDTLYGGNGTDYIYPGPGNDFIWTDNIGSQSTDYVYEGVGTGVDTIADFTSGDGANHDVLVLSAPSSNIVSFADVQAKAFQAGVYTVLPISATDQVYLYNVQPFQLTANDFIFT